MLPYIGEKKGKFVELNHARKKCGYTFLNNHPYSESCGIDSRERRERLNVVVLIVLTESYWRPCIC
jgi:hypothetical protein